jgi:hypothetical protein
MPTQRIILRWVHHFRRSPGKNSPRLIREDTARRGMRSHGDVRNRRVWKAYWR